MSGTRRIACALAAGLVLSACQEAPPTATRVALDPPFKLLPGDPGDRPVPVAIEPSGSLQDAMLDDPGAVTWAQFWNGLRWDPEAGFAGDMHLVGALFDGGERLAAFVIGPLALDASTLKSPFLAAELPPPGTSLIPSPDNWIPQPEEWLPGDQFAPGGRLLSLAGSGLIPDPESWIPNPDAWVPSPESWVLGGLFAPVGTPMPEGAMASAGSLRMVLLADVAGGREGGGGSRTGALMVLFE